MAVTLVSLVSLRPAGPGEAAAVEAATANMYWQEQLWAAREGRCTCLLPGHLLWVGDGAAQPRAAIGIGAGG